MNLSTFINASKCALKRKNKRTKIDNSKQQGPNVVKFIFRCIRKWLFTPVIILPAHAASESSSASAEKDQCCGKTWHVLPGIRTPYSTQPNFSSLHRILLLLQFSDCSFPQRILWWPVWACNLHVIVVSFDSNNRRNFTRKLPKVHIRPGSCAQIMIYSCIVPLSSTNDGRLLLKALTPPSKWIYALYGALIWKDPGSHLKAGRTGARTASPVLHVLAAVMPAFGEAAKRWLIIDECTCKSILQTTIEACGKQTWEQTSEHHLDCVWCWAVSQHGSPLHTGMFSFDLS